MLEQMRKQSKIFIIIVAVAFILTILFSWGMDITGLGGKSARSTFVGSVDGQEISYYDYNNMIQQTYGEYKQQYPDREIAERDMQQIRENAWQKIINQIMVNKLLKKYDITVSDNEVVELIKLAPPREVQQITQFHTDGKFDYNKYRSFLSNPQSGYLVQQMEYIFRTSFPNDKLYYRFFSTINVTDMELKDYYFQKNEKIKIAYISYGAERIPDDAVVIDSAAVKAYYEEHKEDYKTPEKLQLEMVQFDKTPQGSDLTHAAQKAQAIYQELKKGAEFGALVVKYSDDLSTRDKGGNLGLVKRGSMKPEFENVLFMLDSAEYSEPFHTPYGWHIVICDGKETGEGDVQSVLCRQILIKETASPERMDSLLRVADMFNDKIREKNFDEALKTWNITPQIIDSTSRTSFFLPQVGYLEGFDFFLQTAQEERVSNMFTTDKGIFIFRVKKVYPPEIKPYAEVARQIVNQLKIEKKVEALKPQIEEIEKRIGSVQNLGEIDSALKPDTSTLFSRMDNVPKIGSGNELIGLGFKLSLNQIGGAILHNNRYFFIQLIDRMVPSDEEFIANRDAIMQEYDGKVRNIRAQEWLMRMRENIKVEDKRSEYF